MVFNTFIKCQVCRSITRVRLQVGWQEEHPIVVACGKCGTSLSGSVKIGQDRPVKGTRVDGIYTADPEKDPTATKFDDITYDEVLARGLKVMDLTATCMCKENNLPIIVFDMDTVGNLKKVMSGENIGTLVHN